MIHDVMIAGAGPVGLFLACELRLAGLSVLVLEQSEDPASPLKRLPLGLRGLSAPTLEAFYRRGLLDQIAAKEEGEDRLSAAAHWKQQPRAPVGHFAGIQIFQDRIDASAWPYRLDSPAGVSLPVEMARLEYVLAARALAMGVEIRRGVAVEALDASGDGVIVRAGPQTFRGLWLVGCDGGRSMVRKAAGFDFAGTEPEFTGYLLDVELADPQALAPGRHYTPGGMYTYARPGTVAMVEFDGGAFHRTSPIGLDHVQAVLRRVSGVPVEITDLKLASTWTDRAFQARAYRRGRVLLAGDAAHVHSPLGGQGLNLGIGDAMNLGWKLAATVRGEASPGLLDSYFAERGPVGAQVLDWSRAQVVLMRPDAGSRALAAVVRDLLDTSDGATYVAERLWGVGLRYDVGQGHPLAGRTAPDFELADGSRLGDHLRSGRGLFLDFGDHAPLRDLAARWNGQATYVAQMARERLGLSAVLVRPDGVVAWAADDVPDLGAAAAAASRWFGETRERICVRTAL